MAKHSIGGVLAARRQATPAGSPAAAKNGHSYKRILASVKSKWRRTAGQFGVVLALLCAWQLAGMVLFPESGVFPTPVEVLAALLYEIPLDELLRDAAASVTRVVIGVVLAAVCGVCLGALIGCSQCIEDLASPIVEVLRPISPIAWIPMAILWFGVNEGSAWFIIFIAAFFPILTNTVAGVHSVSVVHGELARSLRLSKWLYFWHIVIPTALPSLVVGLRIGLGIGWMAVIAAEMVAAQSGLGYFIQLNRFLLRSEWVLAGMLVIGLIGYTMNYLAVLAGNCFMPWAIGEG